MKKNFTALLHGVDEPGSISVSFPDFPGCVSCGDTVDEALRNGREALEFHLEGMLEDNLPVPEHSDKNEVAQYIKECKESVYPALIEVEIPETCKERVNITLPRYVLHRIDDYTEQHHLKRSAFLSQAALQYISTHPNYAQ
ncbi:MAG: type II toxin-antitoxin system HicB family antitoxin [Victivallaceae bacterium]|nr:type II toxin-antitoxin system HicB family antitoxin [Victivallaceae bacterium]